MRSLIFFLLTVSRAVHFIDDPERQEAEGEVAWKDVSNPLFVTGLAS